MRDDGTNGVLSLPGLRPPELEVFSDSAVQGHFATTYSVDVNEALSSVDDHHGYADALASLTRTDKAMIVWEACRAYATNRDRSELEPIVQFLKREFG
jgi:hypothetical protein